MKRAGVVLLTLAAACGAPPRQDPELPFALPEAWTAGSAAEGTGRADWWESFGDPALSSLVAEAARANPGLRAAAARVEAAIAQGGVAGADLWPQANARADARRQKQNFLGLPIPGADEVVSSRFSTFGVSLDLSWEIDLWGRLRARDAAARADVQAAQADFAGARLSLLAQTCKAYFAAVEASRQLELARATAESNRTTTERIRERHRMGLRPALDLRLAEANLAASEAVLRAREEVRDRAVRQLEIIVGRYPAARVETAGELVAVPPPVPAGLPSELLRRRPDLAAAERRLAAAGARVSEAHASLFPRLTLTASGGTSTDALRHVADPDYAIWSLAAGLLAPLFQGGRLRAGVDLAVARRDEESARYVERVLSALSDVESTLAAEGILRAREESSRAAAEHARAALEISEERYAAGLVDIVTLLDAQRRAYAAESERLAVRRLRLDARVNLHLALGGGFEREGR